MKELVFALEFKGSAGPVPGSENRLRAKTSASGQMLRSIVKPDGIQAAIEPAGGDAASFESEVEIVGDGAFLESGTITYGGAGRISFKTVGRGYLGPSPLPGIQELFAFRPETAGPMRALAQQLLRGPSSLTPVERETIAAVVSFENECVFCARSHEGAANALAQSATHDLP